MLYQEYIYKFIKIQDKLLDFLEKKENVEENYQNLNDYLIELKYSNDRYTFKLILYIISNISKYHQRNSCFFQKIERFLLDLKSYIIDNFTNYEIFQIFKGSKPIILFLLQEKIITIDQSIYNKIIHKNNYQIYFKPELDSFIKNEEKIEYSTEFQEKRQKGENDSYICQIIRDDLVNEFSNFVEKNGYPLNSKINPSIFETNSLLNKKSPALIEYAAFYGSFQIFNFLHSKGIELDSSLWIYGIHSNNLEMINLFEENKIKPDNIKECFFEAIKCHHNEPAKYIHKKYIIENNNLNEKDFLSCCFHYYNFSFIPKINFNEFILDCSCKYDYYRIVEYFLMSKKFNFDAKTVFLIKLASEKDNKNIIYLLLSKLTVIDDNLFKDCDTITSIKIPSSIKSITNDSFKGCTSLTDISFAEPCSITSIEKHCFENCISLTNISIPLNVISIKKYSFKNCTSLKTVTIPTTVEFIGKKAFKNCTLLNEIYFKILSSVKIIGTYSFVNCSSLTQFTIPNSVISIEDYAFHKCAKLANVSIPSSVESIGNNAFSKCTSLTQIIIPSSVKSIGIRAFNKCKSLNSIKIESDLFLIRDYTFNECSALNQIEIPNKVTAICEGAFRKCSSLKEILIPSSVKSIDKYAFALCDQLADVYIQSSEISIGDGAFFECPLLKEITVPSSSKIGKICADSKIKISII